ncbi:MAG: cupin domain-containing protein [Pseudomonadales bacterium]
MAKSQKQTPIVVPPGAGRSYAMGRMSAVFKADLEETNATLSASEWWLEPNTEGPPLHQHPEAHLFYVLEGTLSVYLEGSDWFPANKGACIYVPGGTQHGFENITEQVSGFLSINTPGGFEASLPQIQQYFVDQPLGDAEPKKTSRPG